MKRRIVSWQFVFQWQLQAITLVNRTKRSFGFTIIKWTNFTMPFVSQTLQTNVIQIRFYISGDPHQLSKFGTERACTHTTDKVRSGGGAQKAAQARGHERWFMRLVRHYVRKQTLAFSVSCLGIYVGCMTTSTTRNLSYWLFQDVW